MVDDGHAMLAFAFSEHPEEKPKELWTKSWKWRENGLQTAHVFMLLLSILT